LIRRKDRAPIFCAAIGQYPNAEHEPDEHDGFVFIKADSKGGMVDIDDWQPVTLNPELAREWMNPATPKERAEQIMLLQWEPTEAFEWFKVDRPVGSIHNPQTT
jgi:putative SOS response-associated peptidase YedK